MKRRVFVAINLPEELRRELINWQKLHQNLPVRWTKPDSLHITLAFIGYVSEDELFKICQLLKKVAFSHQPFYIKLNKILPGPPGRTPRMIWVEGESSQEIIKLKEDLDRALLEKPWGGSFQKENRPFRIHITLARVLPNQVGRLSLPEEKLDYDFAVNSIELMESNLKRDGAEYSILESFELGESS